jgi:hypothetical protein
LIVSRALAEQGAMMPASRSQPWASRSWRNVQSERGMSKISLLCPWNLKSGLVSSNETLNCIFARSPSNIAVSNQDDCPCSLMAAGTDSSP